MELALGLEDLPQPTLRERWRNWRARQKCDGCFRNFRVNRVTPVSGDAWLCDACFKRWYPEFAQEKP